MILASGFSDAIGAILNALGAVLAWFYGIVGNYGVAIILLTVVIRVILLPLGIKQIRSMQAMQAIQPKVKQLQQKYKGDRERLNQEMMGLYREHGVNPFSGCLPLLLQFPVLIALFAVLKVPGGAGHIPAGSDLRAAIQQQHTSFLGTNLLCSAAEAGKQVTIKVKPGEKSFIDAKALNCGSSGTARIPYYAFALAMLGTTYYQQRQMQKATPGGNQQQQALTKIMPLLFGVWGYLFPAGLVVYWTTTNLVQIGQQQFMLPRIQAAQAAGPPPKDGPAGDGKRRGGAAPGQRSARGSTPARGGSSTARPRPSGGPRAGSGRGRPTVGNGGAAGGSKSRRTGQRPTTGGGSGGDGADGRGTSGGLRSSGGGNAGDRKKRRKR